LLLPLLRDDEIPGDRTGRVFTDCSKGDYRRRPSAWSIPRAFSKASTVFSRSSSEWKAETQPW